MLKDTTEQNVAKYNFIQQPMTTPSNILNITHNSGSQQLTSFQNIFTIK
jgi:hypothetical protein